VPEDIVVPGQYNDLTRKDQLNSLNEVLRDLAGRFSTAVPTGAVLAWTTATAPTGFVLCNGAAISRSNFTELFTVIGTTYGTGDGSTTFNVPNLQGRVPVGFDSTQVEFDVLAETGGAKTHTLTTAETPAHTHTTPMGRGNVGGTASGGDTVVTYNNTDVTGSTGGGGAHNNLQPYLVLYYIIKT